MVTGYSALSSGQVHRNHCRAVSVDTVIQHHPVVELFRLIFDIVPAHHVSAPGGVCVVDSHFLSPPPCWLRLLAAGGGFWTKIKSTVRLEVLGLSRTTAASVVPDTVVNEARVLLRNQKGTGLFFGNHSEGHSVEADFTVDHLLAARGSMMENV